MNNIGNYEFCEDCKVRINKLAELTNSDEKFVTDALRIISLKTFNNVLKDADKSIIDELKKYADDQEMFQSFFRTKFDEAKVKTSFIEVYNEYLTGFIENCGGNYSDEINIQLEALKI